MDENSISNTVVLILTLIYAALGFTLFIYNKESIVIANRLPNLLLVEQTSFLVASLVTLLFFYQSVYEIVPCEVYHIVMSFTLFTGMVIVIARLSFAYNYLITKKNQNKYGLSLVGKVFWTETNQLKTRVLVSIIGILCVSSILNIVIQNIIEGKYVHTINECTNKSVTVLTYFNYVSSVLLIVYTFQIIRHKVIDKIFLSIEIVMFTISILIVLVYIFVVYGTPTMWFVYFESIIAMFYGLHFPFFVCVYHNSRMRKITSDQVLLPDKVRELCCKFYCEENAIFIEQYEKYKIGEMDADGLKRVFIENGSPYELNISFELKDRVLKANKDQFRKEIDSVFDEIMLLIKLNIYPYLDD